MAKKSFKDKGVDTLLGKVKKEETSAPASPVKKKAGRPKDPNKRIPEKSSQKGTKNDETRATFIVKEDLLEQLKNIAWWDRKKIKDVIGEALSKYIDQWEEENGLVKPRT
jgi:hypothetical protein